MKTFFTWLSEARKVTDEFVRDWAQRVLDIDSPFEEELSFVKAMFEDPSRIWKVYADWLEERGDLRYEIMNLLYWLSLPGQSSKNIKEIIERLKKLVPDSDIEHHAVFNSKIPNAQEWFNQNPLVRKRLLYARGKYLDEETLYRILPHGSGIDAEWNVENVAGNWLAHNSYHIMDEYGGYAGWIGFTVTIPKSNPLNFDVEMNEDDMAQFDDWEDVYVDDLGNYIHETIFHALQNYFHGSS